LRSSRARQGHEATSAVKATALSLVICDNRISNVHIVYSPAPVCLGLELFQSAEL
jgi:hypothetical protein